MGRILFGGTAALLICIFLSPKFIDFLRKREFGQQIREDGPQGHHQKAGTPTMGGIIIFLAVAVPFLILTEFEWRSMGVFGAAIACADEARDHDRDLAGAVVRGGARGAPADEPAAELCRLPRPARPAVPAAD